MSYLEMDQDNPRDDGQYRKSQYNNRMLLIIY